MKAAVAGTAKVVGAGVVMVGIFMLKICLGSKEKDKEGFDPDPLWHQGYGFNNPNNERIKNGQPVLNFDGSVAD